METNAEIKKDAASLWILTVTLGHPFKVTVIIIFKL